MPQTYQKLENGQFIMTFADLEGDLPFLQRSLELYKEDYKKLFPKSPLADDDFTVADFDTDKPYIKFPDNVICVNIGDLTDKTRSNTGRNECYNLKLVDIFSNTHNKYDNRMVSILGNRETTKFRLQNELKNDHIKKVLEQELQLLSMAQHKSTADKRPVDCVWVDGPAKTFLTYLKIAILLEKKKINSEDELKISGKLNLDDQKFIEISEQEVRTFLEGKEEEQQQIIYAKWMLANSCGAPDLWNDIATEAKTTNNDSATLGKLKEYFSDAGGAYVNYLKHCQIGAQIGATLFTHGGLEDSSFNMPKTLLQVLTEEQIKKIFGAEAVAETIPQVNERVVTNSAIQMLRALNTWYATLMAYRFNNEAEKNEVMEAAIAELLDMGLPRGRHQGASLINIAFTDKDGAYGNQITPETHAKLIKNGNAEPIYISYQGHMPAERPRIGTVFNQVDGQDVLLHRLDGDTCNYRKGKAAVALSMHSNNGHTVVNLTRVDQSSDAKLTSHLLTSRSGAGKLETPEGKDFNGTAHSYFGRQVKFSEEDKGWNVVDYIPESDSYILFKQNGFPKFNPETRDPISAAELNELLEIKSAGKSQTKKDEELGILDRTELTEKPQVKKADNEEESIGKQLITAALLAQTKYASHYHDNKLFARGQNGFFSWLRHGKIGQANALKFVNEIQDGNVGQHIQTLLTSPSTRYHRHSFSSYLLAEIEACPALKESLQLTSINGIYDRNACLEQLKNANIFEVLDDSKKTAVPL